MKRSELKKIIKEEIQRLNEIDIKIDYAKKSPGQYGEIITITGKGASVLAKYLQIKDGWKLQRIEPGAGHNLAAYNSGDRLTFFANKNDFEGEL